MVIGGDTVKMEVIKLVDKNKNFHHIFMTSLFWRTMVK